MPKHLLFIIFGGMGTKNPWEKCICTEEMQQTNEEFCRTQIAMEQKRRVDLDNLSRMEQFTLPIGTNGGIDNSGDKHIIDNTRHDKAFTYMDKLPEHRTYNVPGPVLYNWADMIIDVWWHNPLPDPDPHPQKVG
jgi:hypothetical protein